MSDLTHIDSNGNAIMVDVSEKDRTERTASAMGSIYMLPKTLALINSKDIKKGEIISADHIRSIRPGYGLSPKFLKKVIGMKAVKSSFIGDAVAFDYIK